MKKSMISLAALIFAASTFAGSIYNKDGKKYDLEINGNTTYIEKNTNGCSVKKGDTVKNKTNGETIKVDFDGTLVIENGKFKKL